MSARAGKPETVVPTDLDMRLAKNASRKLADASLPGKLRLRLDDGAEIEVPRSASRLIALLLEQMAAGNAVAVLPVHAELTTQEAADFLNVSRPYLIRLLEEGRLAFHKVGTHRRVRLADLVAFRTEFERGRDKALGELSEQAQALKLGY
jgi:excisionase family DNA binding protein